MRADAVACPYVRDAQRWRALKDVVRSRGASDGVAPLVFVHREREGMPMSKDTIGSVAVPSIPEVTPPTDTAPSGSRRQLLGRLLGVAAGGIALEALAGCIARAESGDDEDIAEVVQALTGNGTLKWADTATALRGLTGGSAGWIAALQGYNAPGDGGGGVFYWSTTSKPDDGWLVLNSGSGNSAGWRRVNPGLVSADTVTILRGLSGAASRSIAVLQRYTTPGDGGGGCFRWDTAAAVDDGGTILNSGGLGTSSAGWRRIYSGPLDVRWFGAKGDGASLDDAAIQAAVNALPATGGAVYIPPGTYKFSDNGSVNLRANNHVIGAGPYASILVRPSTGSTSQLIGVFVDGCTIEGLGFELQNTATFANMIWVGDPPTIAKDTTIRSCMFRRSTKPQPLVDTIHGILAKAPEHLLIEGCHFKWCQVLAASTGTAKNVKILANTFFQPFNWAITTVGADPSGVIEDILIQGNTVQDCVSSGAIAIGTDGESNHNGAIRRITIRDNHIYGSPGTDGHGNGIQYIMCDINEDVRIEGNVIRLTPAINNGNNFSIQMKSHNNLATTPTAFRVTIAHNDLNESDLQAVSIAGAIEDLLIAGNIVNQSRGIAITAEDTGMRRVTVRHNIIAWSSAAGIALYAQTANMKQVLVEGNTIMNSLSEGIRLERGANLTLAASVRGNIVTDDQATPTQDYGILLSGSGGTGSFDVVCQDNDLRSNQFAAFSGYVPNADDRNRT